MYKNSILNRIDPTADDTMYDKSRDVKTKTTWNEKVRFSQIEMLWSIFSTFAADVIFVSWR